MATTTQAADIARHVAGEDAVVEQILEPNADPHAFEPRPSDAIAVGGADLIIRSGGPVDAWSESLVDGAGNEAPLLDVLRDVVSAGADADPHWWQDPAAGAAAAAAIRNRLVELDPANASAYRRNAAAFEARLKALDAAIAGCVSRVSPDRRRIVSAHDSLGYFADRYGIEIVGAAIPAQTSQAQPSAGEISRLVDAIRDERVSAVFPEAGTSPGLEQAIARDSGATIGGELWADTLGPAGSSGATYMTALAANADALVAGMSGGDGGCPDAVEAAS